MMSTGSSPLIRHTTSCLWKEIKGGRPSFGGSILCYLAPGIGLCKHRITSQVCTHTTLLVRFCHLCKSSRQSTRYGRPSRLIPRCVMVCQCCMACLYRTRCAATPPRLLFESRGQWIPVFGQRTTVSVGCTQCGGKSYPYLCVIQSRRR